MPRSPSRHGTGHFCVFVQNIDALYEDLAAKGVRFRSDGPVEMTTGPNAGGKSLYSLDPDGYVFEFHQRPPMSKAETPLLVGRPPERPDLSSSTGGWS